MKNIPPLLPFLIAFITGIATQQLFPLHIMSYWPTLIFFSVLGILLNHHKWYKISLILFLLCAYSLGAIRAESTQHIPSPMTVDYYASEERNKVTLLGSIVEEPDIRRDKVNYTVQVSQLLLPSLENPKSQTLNPKQNPKANGENEKQEIDVSGKILIATGKYPSYNYGDTVEISGHLRPPGSFDTFDYTGYLSRYDIYAVMYQPFVSLMENPKTPEFQTSKFGTWSFRVLDPGVLNLGPSLYSLLLKTKKIFETQMNRTFSTEPSSSFMAGLLLGSRKGIPEELSEAFRITGLTHIIAISGYNITLIVTILMSLFKPFGKKLSIIISSIGIVLFTFFVGASAAVVRACIMGLIGLFALNSNRKSAITITLFMTAALMIGYNPKILFHDVGFQLSFLATMGLIYVSPLIEAYFSWLPKKLAIRESVLLTLSAQIMALPIILLNFQGLSVVSPLSNLLISGPIIPFSMLFGFLGTMVSFVSLSLAKLLAYPAYLLLQYIINITKLTAEIPYANIEITWFQKAFFISYFILLSVYLVRKWTAVHEREQNIRLLQLEQNQRILYRLYVRG